MKIKRLLLLGFCVSAFFTTNSFSDTVTQRATIGKAPPAPAPAVVEKITEMKNYIINMLTKAETSAGESSPWKYIRPKILELQAKVNAMDPTDQNSLSSRIDELKSLLTAFLKYIPAHIPLNMETFPRTWQKKLEEMNDALRALVPTLKDIVKSVASMPR